MAVEIIPSVLARRLDQFRVRLALAERVSHRVHVDVMDGKFVPTRSVTPEALVRFPWRQPVELHLMVKEPERWLEVAMPKAIGEVIIPVELGPRLRYCIALFRSNGKKISLAINPTTPLSRLWPWLEHVKQVHVMTVRPGRYHAAFIPAMIDRVAELHVQAPRLRITCDGGVTPKTIGRLVQAGARRMIVGSYLQNAEHPRRAWHDLQMASQR